MGLKIGMDAGFATLGRIGYEGRYSYGAIGRVVVSAALIARQARPGAIYASQSLASALDDRFTTKLVGDVGDSKLTKPLKIVEIVHSVVPV